MDKQLESVTGDLGPLLLEARNLMHLQERAIASGIRIDSSFVRSRIDGWDQAMSGVRETFATLGVGVASLPAGDDPRG